MIDKYFLDEIAVNLASFITTEVRIKPAKLAGIYHLNFCHVSPEFRDRFVIPDVLRLLETWHIKKKYDDINVWTEEELRYLKTCFDLKKEPEWDTSWYK